MRSALRVYTTVFRGIPELIVILALDYGGAMLISAVMTASGMQSGWEPPKLATGVAALSLTFGAYATEIFRSAMLAVPRGDIEAAYSLGMARRHVYGRIVLPQISERKSGGASRIREILSSRRARLLSLPGFTPAL